MTHFALKKKSQLNRKEEWKEGIKNGREEQRKGRKKERKVVKRDPEFPIL